MSLLAVFITFIISFILGLFIYANIIFPIFYFLPKSIYLTIRGRLKYFSILRCLLTPFIWFLIFFFLGYFFPNLISNEYTLSTPSNLGQLFSILALIFNGVFKKDGREANNSDYWEMMKNYIIN
jgi:hypothetical protein